jgi:hypothetical protein
LVKVSQFPGRKGVPHNNVDLWYTCDMYTWQRRSPFIRDKPIHSSERMLHKDYNLNDSVAKKKNAFVISLKGLGTKTN